MKKYSLALIVFLLFAPAQAHHIWIVPGEKDENQAFALFSDNLEPDRAELLKKIKHAECWLLDTAGKETPLRWEQQDNLLAIDAPGKGPRRIGGRCVYGVETHDHRLRRDVDPYLLVYYPQALLSTVEATKAWDRLPLQVLSKRTEKGIDLSVLFDGKPAAGAELILFTPGSTMRESFEANEKGRLSVRPKTPGLYAFRTRYVEPRKGTHQGKDYSEVRHYASLVLRWSE